MYSCQTLQIYIPQSKTKILTRPFLLVILMATHSSGGPMGTQLRSREIENLISSLNLSQLISEPNNFEPNKNLSCIDLFITDQPNLITGDIKFTQ